MREVQPIQHVAVVGAGTMGSGIAAACLRAGLRVTLIDIDDRSLERGKAAVRKIVDGDVAKGRVTAKAAEALYARFDFDGKLESVGQADLVIEAIIEDLAVKRRVFAELDAHARPEAILATNTSTLDVNAIAAATSRPANVIGLHFFSPAHVMRLLEIVEGAQTSPQTVLAARDFAQCIGKVGVVVGVCYGFVGNRMLEPYSREAHRLLLDGASPEQIDRVLTDFGMAMGVLSMCDLAGNDVGALIRRGNSASFADDPSYCRMGDVLFERGEFGQKSGLGYYVYSGRDKAQRSDFEGMCRDEAARLGIARRSVSDDEIFERCLYSLVNEGLLILEEGIARTPDDIDTIWRNGYGFPEQRGGPMRWAQEHGFGRIHDRMLHWRSALGEYGARWFSPAPILTHIAEEKIRLEQILAQQEA